jgi:acid phosphatase
MLRRLLVPVLLFAAALVAIPVAVGSGMDNRSDKLSKINHIVAIYQENHSFDNLYGGWEGVNGRADADAAQTTQVSQAGAPFACLLQNDVNLTVPPLTGTCSATSHFTNAPFAIDSFLAPSDTTCAGPTTVFNANGYVKGAAGNLPGGCTRDIVHRFYSEQYQLDGGRQDRFVTGSDAAGLAMGYYETTALPIYQYLHSPAHPRYAIADDFFQAAFGGSFLNHQWLIAATTPPYNGAVPASQRTILDSNGMATSTPLYVPTGPVSDKAVTASCPAPLGLACGDFAINTIQPVYQPHSGSATLPALTNTTIGDELSSKGVDWAWYAGGWSNADGDVNGPGWTNGSGPSCSDPNVLSGSVYPNCPDRLFQFHHQPFNYFYNYRPGTAARAAHLRDEQEFLSLTRSSVKSCDLKPVSFVKPIGEENEHPGYASESVGSDHLVQLLQAIEGSSCAKDTMVVVTYDEFGGQWDHLSPPGQGGAPGPHDQWGPGTRIPALIVSPFIEGNFVVDSREHDTTLDPRDDRAPLRRPAALDARRGRDRPLDRVRREEAEHVTSPRPTRSLEGPVRRALTRRGRGS